MSGDAHHDAPACPPEWTLSVYVDGELDAADMRDVDGHLVGCRACREVVVALRDEAAAMTAAFSLGDVEAKARASAPVAPRDLAFGTGTIVIGTLAALTVFGSLLAIRIPAALGWLNPFELGGTFAMLFDAVSLARQQAPGLYQLAVGAAGLLGTAFVLTTSFTLATRRLAGGGPLAALLCAFGLSAFAPAQAQAIALFIDDEMHDESEQVVRLA